MKKINNLWENDKGFIWMLGITVLTLISLQLPTGVLAGDKFIIRSSFFLFTLIAVKSSALSSRRKSTGYFIAGILMVLAVILMYSENHALSFIYTIGITLYMIFILMLVINQIFAGGIITVNKIVGGIAAYILIGHLWTSLYATVYMIEPDSFLYSGEVIPKGEALRHLSYFSFVSLTTMGFGDLVAVGSLARILVVLEGLIGQLFPAIFIAKLVSLQIEDSRKK